MLVSVTMTKDEADIIEPILRHTATQVDHMIVADNGSTDGTRELLDVLAQELPLTVLDDPVVGYLQSPKMSALAQIAAQDFGAEWVLPIDSDEFWYSPFGRIGDILATAAHKDIAPADVYDHVATGDDDASEPNPLVRMTYRRRARLPLGKVACRVKPDLVIEQGNHGAHYGTELPPGVVSDAAMHAVLLGQLVIRHFPYRSAEQFISKARNGAAAYAATDLPYTTGQHWRDYGALLEAHGEAALQEVYEKWFFEPYPRFRSSELVVDPVCAL